MSSPQNPQQPHHNGQQPPPQPPQGGGFGGPPPTWGPEGTGHAQPTMVGGQPAVPPPPPPGPVPGAGAAQQGRGSVPPPPGPVPGGAPGGAPGPYGAGPGMAPMPAPAPAPTPPSRGGNKKVLAIVGGVVALAVIGGGIAFAVKGGSGGDDKKEDAKGASTAPKDPAGPQASAPAPAPGGGQGTDKPADGGYKAPAGWQSQVYERHGFAYDVPGKGEKWKVLPGDTMISYTADGKPVVAMTGTANFREGGCSSNPNPDTFGEAGKGQLATVGTTGGGKDGDLRTNARNWAGNWGVMAYGGTGANKPKIEVSQATPWKHNGIEGYTATAKVKVTHRPSACVPPTAIVKSIAQKLPDGTFHGWVIYADQGVPDALSEEQIDKIMQTVRPAAAH
ncbi:hypothetical protein [Streptomyces mobaraensis]|uniref:hypothetical protein n=1 Tax=Streptomyces mobaraensis TaxID=35621 RepID=UPI001F043F68|nr:hypothetical protein [Streptomyces mobaraensis]